VPQTICGPQVAKFCMAKTGLSDIIGDGDPLDLCVLTEKNIAHGDIFLRAIPIGGLRMLDGNESDDKIISVLEGDPVHGNWKDIADCPQQLIDRLQHYFLTYKMGPGDATNKCSITHIFGAAEAREVIQYSRQDYSKLFPDIENLLTDIIARYNSKLNQQS
jgi:inorganic pyrophosphatase